MAHIAFFNIPQAGHINPTLGLVTELTNRGHHTTYTATQPFTTPITTAGAKLIPYETAESPIEEEVGAFADPGIFTEDDLRRRLHWMLREAVTVLSSLGGAFAAGLPDLVVYDAPCCWSGRLLAHRWAVPAMRTHATLLASRDWWPLERCMTFDLRRPVFAPVVGAVGRLLRKLNLDITVEDFFAGCDDHPGVAFFPRSFQIMGETFADDAVRFVGPSPAPGPGHPGWTPPADDRPVALISLGTIGNRHPAFFRACVQAFTGRRWHVVIATGDGIDPDLVGPVPPNIEVHPYVPQREVLRHADVFICHGGMGSVMDALTEEVPLVVIPLMVDDRVTADRVVELGLGRRLFRERFTTGALREAVEAVAGDARVRTELTRMRRAIADAGGHPAAADAVEKLLASTAGPARSSSCPR